MKKTFVLIIAFSLAAIHSIAHDVKAYLLYSTFNSPANGPYVETYLSIMGNSLVFKKNSNGKYQGGAEVSMAFIQNGEIKAVKKYNVLSPETDDTIKGRTNFLDLQRISLPNGNYDFEITIADMNKGGKPFTSTQKLTIDIPADKVVISDVQLVESFKRATEPGLLTKSGYDLVPYVSTFYPANMSKLPFYAEIYNAKSVLGENEKYLVSYFLESADTKVQLKSFSSFSRQTANDVNVLLAELSIDQLASGNYNLVIEVRNRLNELITDKRINFQRSNPKAKMFIEDMASLDLKNTFVDKMTSRDTLEEYIRCLYPISDINERTWAQNQIGKKDLTEMQRFFLGFWRNRNVENPEKAWLAYFEEVKKVQKEFATQIKKGYETDRGRVYLQYGSPNQRTQSTPEPSAYPYEIWQYYQMADGQTNRKFVFYNPDLVTNDYQLIHSTAQGEIYDTRWEMKVHNRNNQSRNFDVENSQDHFGGQTKDLFNNPR